MMSNILMTRMFVTNKAIRLTQMSSILINKSMIRSSTTSATSETEDYFVKNKGLKRPLSPYTIYKIQLTSMLSITHRATGLALGVLLYGGGIASLGSQSTNFAQILSTVSQSVPHSLIFTFKVLAGTAIVYHSVNGLRHLAWDFGYGFGLKELYISGYVVLVITLLAAIGLIMTKS